MKKRNPSEKEAYSLIPLAIENALGFIDAGELLCKGAHYGHGFIMASYATEEIGKAVQLQAIACGFDDHLSFSDHKQKNKAFLLQTFLNYFNAQCQNELEQLSPEIITDQNGLQTFASKFPQIKKKVEQFINHQSNIYDWMDLRFRLLYTNVGDTHSIREKWKLLREEFEIARLVEEGIAFEGLRNTIELFKITTPACYDDISFEDFRNSIPDWIYEFRQNPETTNKETDKMPSCD